MSNLAKPSENQLAKLEQVLLRGDLSVLSEAERVQYYKTVCDLVGLNPTTKPFEYINLNGKLVLYATKGCAEQLRQRDNISIRITSRETIEGVYVVTAAAQRPDGRVDESTGAVQISGLKGDSLANAMMKAETKAKRRVTLSVCGLNMLDETEVESIPDKDKNKVFAQQPSDNDGYIPADYRVNFGQWRGLSIDQIIRDKGPNAIADYIDYLERPEQVSKRKTEQVEKVAEFIERASDAIAALERGEIAI